ncbi:hypothetical protein F1728_21270 [Gimesia benthica]|uniref:PDZ domain-containing protein n=1 Tax=Gimesia benthica TaxID=2608982 RepID=A0A6I6AF18_9PLAN|nr:hypothetical protein [Gimesia benthica]QGQ25063.1 hypothetical protein F1728_21270 [Gimesia benthica]
MRFLMMNVIILCFSSVSVLMAEELPSIDYPALGFRTVKVLDYKKALREQGEEIPRFPPRSGNALIVKMDQYQTRINSALTVVEDTRASRSELKDRDLIVVINGKLLRSPDDGDKLLEKITHKDKLELNVIRRNRSKWERINITLEPMGDLEFSKSKVKNVKAYDDDFALARFGVHRDARPRFSDGHFQLYIKQKSQELSKLYLQLSLFLPDAPPQKDTTKIQGFIIKTDGAEYRVAIEDEEKNNPQAAEARRNKSIANFSEFYNRSTNRTRKMLDELGEKISNFEKAPEETLIEFERRGIARSQVGFARMLEGWELYDSRLKRDQRKMIADIISSKKVSFYHESVPDKPFEVTPAQKAQMKAVLTVFKDEEGNVGE